MGDAKGQAEPSMEEILESIRRIIAEDGEAAGEDEDVLVLREPAPESEPGEEVLELTDAVEEEGAPDRTLEDPIKELLRPMLKEWLDDNLQPIVSREVARAIVRLAGRAGDD